MEVSRLVSDECDCGKCNTQLQSVETGGCAPPVYVEQSLPGLEVPAKPLQQMLPGIPIAPQGIAQYTVTRTFVFENGEFLCKCEDENAAERVANAMSAAAANDYNVRLLATLR